MSSKITTSLSRIQELDRELVALLQKRFQLARELALTKKISGLPVMDREGERAVIDSVLKMSSDRLEGGNIIAVFRQVLEESRAIKVRTAAAEDGTKKFETVGGSA